MGNFEYILQGYGSDTILGDKNTFAFIDHWNEGRERINLKEVDLNIF